MNGIIRIFYKSLEKVQINNQVHIINQVQIITAWIFLSLFSHQIHHTTYLLLQVYSKTLNHVKPQ